MGRTISSVFIFGLLLTMLVPFAMMDAYALGVPGDMYAGTGRNGPTIGGVFIVSQSGPIVETLVGDPTVGNDALPGVAFDSTGNLFGTTNPGSGSPSNLLQINPTTGAVITDFGTIVDAGFTPLSINDLSVQPGTDIIFGVSSSTFTGSGQLYTISQTSPPVATPVGPNNGLVVDETPIAFAPDGTLYMTCYNCPTIGGGPQQLLTVNPTTGAILTQVSFAPSNGVNGLGVRSDGTIFATGGVGAVPKELSTISVAGVQTIIGNPIERIADVTFFPDVTVGGFDVSINTASLLLAGAGSVSMWMIPVVIAGAGIGVFVISKRK